MDKNTEGRIPIEIIEIDLDFCVHSYGDSNCLAVLEVDRNKCFNTFATCGAVDNYTPTTKTYRFCTDQTDIPVNNLYFPFIKSASVSPGTVNPLGADKSTTTLGKRTVLSATFSDHPTTDLYTDPYQLERLDGTAQFDGIGYDPFDRSTFWRKFKARNPYYKNRVVRYISGYIENGIVSDSITQTFLLTNLSDSDSAGSIKLQAKDPLYLAQREKALAPEPSEGSLSAEMNDSITGLTLSPAGVGNLNYSASGFVRIDSEVMSYTRVGDVLTVARGQYNTIAMSHEADAAVQECLRFNAQLPYQILTTLLQDYAGIASGYLDTAQWFDESVTRNNLPQGYNALITEPTEVEKLLNEMTEQMYFYIWYSSREGKVKIRAVRPIQEDDITELNYSENLMGQLSVNEDASKMVTRVVVNYAMIDPTKNLDELTNFSATEINVNLDLESNNQYRDKKTKIINSRWMGSGSGGAAQQLAKRILYRLSKPLRSFGFSLDAKDRDLWLSDFVAISSPFVVDSVGNELPVNAHVIQAQETVTGSIYTYTAEEYVYSYSQLDPEPPDDGWVELVRTGAGVANNQSIGLRAWWDSEYPATPPTGDSKIRFVIEENVVMNASNTSVDVNSYAILVQTATFPVGCELMLVIKPNAYVVGKGGQGGKPGIGFEAARDGGYAMFLRHPITIINNGIIASGGGGGGGGSGSSGNPINTSRVGGGGGGGGAGGSSSGDPIGGLGGAAGLTEVTYVGSVLINNPSAGNDGTDKLYGVGGIGGRASNLPWPPFLGQGSKVTVYAGAGGNGGGLGQPGQAGHPAYRVSDTGYQWYPAAQGAGALAGRTINGISYVTWEVKGDVRGREGIN